jgi:hypothetical protein
LAFAHHLAIARNVPIRSIITWLVASAPTGVIEFVPKSDPTIQRMLALRQDIFDDYSQTSFEAALKEEARITKSETISHAGRVLNEYDRSGRYSEENASER